MQNKTFYLTTTLPYVNAPLHMGHALEFVRADVIARYKKLVGFDVYFNTGTDEHGIKIYQKATEAGMTAQSFVDAGFETFKKQLEMFGVTDDIHFIRTTDRVHEKLAQMFWNRVNENGFIYKKNYEAKYCVGCESEKTESELVDGFCPDHNGIPLQIINEENYFFKYSEFGKKLLKFYEQNPKFITPEFRMNEMKSFINGGLQDFSISRIESKMPWGIPVPGDSEQVMYVWFDALTNYISTFLKSSGLNAEDVNSLDDLLNNEQFIKYWVNGTPTQYCGKDNTRFQSAMWQAMLMAANVPNSHQIVVNGFITADGGVKMSKTLGNGVDPHDIVNEYGTDALRYFLLREVSSFEDSPFTMERFKNSYNSGLANGLGNLVSRIMTMAVSNNVSLSEDRFESVYFTHEIPTLEDFEINSFVNEVWLGLKSLDEYIQREEPFKKVKTNFEAAKKDIEHLLQHLYITSLMLEPIMPETSKKNPNPYSRKQKTRNPFVFKERLKIIYRHMNKTKIIVSSLLIGLLSGIPSVYLGFFAGIPFGIAVVVCLFIFFKDTKISSRHFFFIIASGIACFVAVDMCMSLLHHINPIFFPALISSFFGSLILILSYHYILKIKLSLDWNIRLVILGVLLSFIMSVSFLTIYIFIFWQPVMLAVMMYASSQVKENKKPENPLFLRKD